MELPVTHDEAHAFVEGIEQEAEREYAASYLRYVESEEGIRFPVPRSYYVTDEACARIWLTLSLYKLRCDAAWQQRQQQRKGG